MARIQTYSNDTYVTGKDKWIGSDANNNFVTKNFTSDAVADYFNRAASIDTGQFAWTFLPYNNTQPQPEKTFMKVGWLTNTININNLAGVLRVSALTIANTTPGVFMQNEWVGKNIIIHFPGAPNAYSIYTVDSLVQDPDSAWYYLMTISFVSGESFFINKDDSIVMGYFSQTNLVDTVTGIFPVNVTTGANPIVSIDTTKLSQWDSAYNNSIVSAAVTGTSSKTLTLNQQDGGTIIANWSDSVTSFNTRTGAITLISGDVTGALGYTPYDSTNPAGYITSAALSGYVPTSRTIFTNGPLSGGGDLTANRTISISQSNSTTDGYLSSADWSTFNSKQSALGGTGLVKSTSGTITYITDNSANWNTAYNDSIVSAAVTGTSTKTLTLNQQDGGTVTASWTDNGLTSVGVSMPSAFNVANSPLTSDGTIAITGAGNTNQYVRGDGSLATYNPGTGGGGASQTFYFNGGTPSTVTGYQQMSTVANTSTGVDFSVSSNGYIASFLTDVNSPNQLLIPAGNWNFEIYMNSSSTGGSPYFYVELYKYNGSAFTLISSSSLNPEYITNGINVDLYTTALSVPATTLALTDRLAVRVYVNTAGRTITMHTQDSNLSEVITTFTTGITALNGLTAQVQNLAVGTSGSDFNISSVTNTHTFNLPTASAVNRGALSSADWTTFNAKQEALTLTTTGTSGAATLVGNTLNIPTYQSVLTNPITGLGTVNYVPKFNTTSSITNSNIQDSGSLITLGSNTAINGIISGDVTQVLPAGNTFIGQTFNLTGSANGWSPVSRTTWNINDDAYTLGAFTGFDTRIFLNRNSTLGAGGVNGFTANILNNGTATQFGVGFSSLFRGTGNYSSVIGFRSGANSPQTNTNSYTDYVGFDISNPPLNITNFYGLNILDVSASTIARGVSLAISSGTGKYNIYAYGTADNYIEGSLLIGTSTNSGYKLDVTGTGRLTGNLTANSFIKIGGTSSQYLRADGSVGTGIVTGTGTTNQIPKFTAANTLGNSSIFDNGTNIILSNDTTINGWINGSFTKVLPTGNTLAGGQTITLTSSANGSVLINRNTWNVNADAFDYGGYTIYDNRLILTKSASAGANPSILNQSIITNNGTAAQTAIVYYSTTGGNGGSGTYTSLTHYQAGLWYGQGGNTGTYTNYNGFVVNFPSNNVTNATGLTVENITASGNARGLDLKVSSGTNKYNIYAQGTADNYLAGALGIGTTSLTGNNLRISKSLTGATASVSVRNESSALSDVTSSATAYQSSIGTQAATFTMNGLYHYAAYQGTFGSGSTVTNQYGYYVDGSLTGAGNNYGFYGNIAASTNRWNLYMNGTANNYLAGSLGIGSTSLTDTNIRVSKNITGAIKSFGMEINSTIQSDVTQTSIFFGTAANTQAATFTLGTLYHFFAFQNVIGSGSTVTNQYGYYAAGTLTGATNNYGFFGDIASGTNRWNLYMNGTANNYMAGSLGIGTSALTGYNLYINKAQTGATTTVGLRNEGTIQSDVTTQSSYFQSVATTAAATFTLGTLTHYETGQSTIGSGSTVTTQVGFNADSSLIGATNNYGFRGRINNGTNRYNLFMSGTADNYLAGSLGIGSASLTGIGFRQSKNITGAINSYGIISDGQVQSDANNNHISVQSVLNTQAATFTLASYTGFNVALGTLGAGTTLTNLYGFKVTSAMNVATNNYGFYGDLAASTGRWNIYMNGTANNYIAGNLLIGSTTDNSFKLQVTGSASISAGLQVPTINQTYLGASKTSLYADASRYAMQTVSGYAIAFEPGGTEKMRITDTGNVLIGSTTDNGSRLQVTGGATFTGSVTSTLAYSNTSDLSFVASANIPGYNLRSSAGGRLSIVTGYIAADISSILVGTGTNNPSIEALRIVHSTGAATFSSSVTAGTYLLSLGQLPAIVASSTFFDYIPSVNYGRFAATSNATNTYPTISFSQYSSNGTLGRDAMIINSSGNVGIGTSNPSGASGLALAINGGTNQTRIALKNSTTGDAAGNGLQILLDAGSLDAAIENRENGHLRFATGGSERIRIKSNGIINFSNVPTSSAGLSSGDIYKTVAGVLMIV